MELEVLCDEITQEFCDLDHLTQTEDNAHRTTADIVVWLRPRGRENDIQIPPFAYTGWEKALKIPSHQRKLFSAVSVRVCKRPLLTEETSYFSFGPSIDSALPAGLCPSFPRHMDDLHLIIGDGDIRGQWTRYSQNDLDGSSLKPDWMFC